MNHLTRYTFIYKRDYFNVQKTSNAKKNYEVIQFKLQEMLVCKCSWCYHLYQNLKKIITRKELSVYQLIVFFFH